MGVVIPFDRGYWPEREPVDEYRLQIDGEALEDLRQDAEAMGMSEEEILIRGWELLRDIFYSLEDGTTRVQIENPKRKRPKKELDIDPGRLFPDY